VGFNTYRLYKSSDGSYTMYEETSKPFNKDLLGPNPVLVAHFRATDWEEAKRKQKAILGW
jgi:hypothetical protein